MVQEKIALITIIIAVISLGCTEPNPFFVDPAASPCAQGDLVIEPFNLVDPEQVDILFVVDDTPGMSDAQVALAASMPPFVEGLMELDLDFHLGVVSTDLADGGVLQTGMPGQEGCPGQREVIITQTTPGAATMAACNVLLGESGDDFTAAFDAAVLATTGPATAVGGANEGFLRPDARLIIVFFSHEDDCSGDSLTFTNPNECVWHRDQLTPLGDYATARRFLPIHDDLGGTPVDVVAIAGPDDGLTYLEPEEPQPVCESNGVAYNGRRYVELTEIMGETGSFHNICNRSYELILLDILEEHIAPRRDLVCPQLPMTQPPVAVRLVDIEDQDRFLELLEGPTGWQYEGPDEACANGTIAIEHRQLGLYENEEVQVFYCATP